MDISLVVHRSSSQKERFSFEPTINADLFSLITKRSSVGVLSL